MKTHVPYKPIVLLLFFGASLCFSQGNFNIPRKDSDKIRFKLVNSLIILPVQLNGVKLSFILDTGVSKPILFNITNTDSLQINNVETISLRGLGGGESVKALKSKNNFLKIGDAVNINQDVFVVFDKSINFTPRLGIPVHGIIGYDVFRDFVVEIKYSSKYLKLHNPKTYEYSRCNKCETFNLSFYNDKPYIDAEVQVGGTQQTVRLLIDTGSTDALWLFENDLLGLKPDDSMQFLDFLGRGLSGNVYGKRSRIEGFRLGNFLLENVNAAFPDSTSISFAKKNEKRNGSLSGGILKRFNMVIDYSNSKIRLRKNRNFKSEFRYDRSGIVLEQKGLRLVREQYKNTAYDSYGRKNEDNLTVSMLNRYRFKLEPAYQIVEIRKGSPAESVGLQKNDIIIAINRKPAHKMTLQTAMGMFQNDIGKTVRLTIERNQKIMKFQFKLENPFKPKKLP